jgi:hypothetical protein
MKKSELKQIIREEIQNILQEEDPIQTAFNKKIGIEPSTVPVMNKQVSKEWMEGYKAFIPGKPKDSQPQNPYLEPESFLDRKNRTDSYAERNKKRVQWDEGFRTAIQKYIKTSSGTMSKDEIEFISKNYKDYSSGDF